MSEIDNNKIKSNSFLLGNVALFIFFITVIGYIVAYEWEILSAWYYGFDIELISISTTVLIKNNVLMFICIAMLLSGIMYEILRKHKNNVMCRWLTDNISCLWKKVHTRKLLIGSITTVLILGIVYTYLRLTYFVHFLSVIGLVFIVLLIIFLLHRMMLETDLVKVCCYLAFLVLSIPLFIFALFFSPISPFNVFNNYKAFDYNDRKFIVLRKYDENLIAKRIDIVKNNNEVFKNNDILYLPISTLKEGIIFYNVRRNDKDEYEVIQ